MSTRSQENEQTSKRPHILARVNWEVRVQVTDFGRAISWRRRPLTVLLHLGSFGVIPRVVGRKGRRGDRAKVAQFDDALDGDRNFAEDENIYTSRTNSNGTCGRNL